MENRYVRKNIKATNVCLALLAAPGKTDCTVHTRFDQAIKQVLHAALAARGAFTPEMEVSPDPQRIDGWFVPDPARLDASAEAILGLLGRMCRTACAFEAFKATPDEGEIVGCVRKLLNLRHILAGKGAPEPPPFLWILCSGRPKTGLRALFAQNKRGFPRGVYTIAPAFHTAIVVANELPEERSTLLLRLVGRGQTLRRAIRELAALPADAFERCIAVPIVVRYRLDMAKMPAAMRTPEDEEVLMASEDILEVWERKVEQRGIEKGRVEGEQHSLLTLYTKRFGPPPEEIRLAISRTTDEQSLLRWLELVVTSTPEAVASAIRGQT